MGVLAENKLALGAAAVGAAAALGYLYRKRSSRSRVVRADPAAVPGGPGVASLPKEAEVLEASRLQDLQPGGWGNERDRGGWETGGRPAPAAGVSRPNLGARKPQAPCSERPALTPWRSASWRSSERARA